MKNKIIEVMNQFVWREIVFLKGDFSLTVGWNVRCENLGLLLALRNKLYYFIGK
jgi:hypothetical protein